MKTLTTGAAGTKLLAIGVFARATGLTIAALRHYDEADLLRPAVVDPESNYRYYLRSQTADAERIRVMRALDIPLDEIRAYLRELDDAVRRPMLLHHRRRVEGRMARDAHALEALNRMERSDLDPIAVAVKTLPTRAVAYTRYVTSIDSVEPDRRDALRRITAFVTAQGRTPGPGFSITLDALPDPIHAGQDGGVWCAGDSRFTVDVGVLLNAPIRPDEGIYAGRWPGTTVAFAVHEGRYEPMHVVYRAVVSWALRRGRMIDAAPREVYLVGPADGPPDTYQTEVQLPLE